MTYHGEPAICFSDRRCEGDPTGYAPEDDSQINQPGAGWQRAQPLNDK